jgi:hypothetical protein
MNNQQIVTFSVSTKDENDAFALKIRPLPKGILPSPKFILRTRSLLLGLSLPSKAA